MTNRVLSFHRAESTEFCTQRSTTLYRGSGTLYRMGNGVPKTFGDRIELILAETGLSQTELAKIAGVNKQTVTEWISGRSKSPRPESLFAIEDQLFYAARWLGTGEGEKKIKKLDPTDTYILSGVERLTPTAKNAVQEFVEFELYRTKTD
jgi:transcriptional regulator with XRE-family HTH domain